MGDIYQMIADSALMTGTPDIAAESTTELLFGERVEMLEDIPTDDIDEDGQDWAKIRNLTDGYEGYIFRGVLDNEPSEPTHKVSALRTFAFSEPDFKSPPLRCLSFYSPLSVVMDDAGFSVLEQGGWVYSDHIKEVSNTSADPLDSALRFLETPYLWGGRSSLGIDCSGLVQLALLDAGHSCPRDTKDQIDAIGKAVKPDDIQKGDFVFFNGHVGIMVNDSKILNATARHMKTCIEKLDDVVASYDGILSVRRV